NWRDCRTLPLGRRRFAFPGRPCYPPHPMRLRRLALPFALAAGLGACGPTISSINARPDKFYQHKVEFTGRIARTQVLPGEAHLEIADRRGARIIVRSTAPVEAGADDWVKVTA